MIRSTKYAIWSLALSVLGIGILLWFGHWEILLGFFLLMWGDNLGNKIQDFKKEEIIQKTLDEWKAQDARETD